MKKKNISLIFDNCDVSASQEIYLQRCGFAEHGQPPPESGGVSPPPINDGVVTSLRASHDSETDSEIVSGYVVVDREAIRLVSLEESSTENVVLEEDESDPTVKIVAEDRNDVSVESSRNCRDERLESPAKENEGKKLKIPLRDVVKAIVMHSRHREEDKNKRLRRRASCKSS